MSASPPDYIAAEAAGLGVVPRLVPEQEALRRVLKAAIPYDTSLSIDGHPELRRGFRTDEDAQRLLDNLVPLVAGLLDNQQVEVVRLLERRARWSLRASKRVSEWESEVILLRSSEALADFARVLRAQKRRWWMS